MKFALIVLLGFCALAAQGTEISSVELKPELRGPILNGIKDIFQKAIKYVTDAVNNVVAKAKAVIDYLKENMGQIVSDAMAEAWKIAKKIIEIGYQGVVAKVCVKPHEARISELIDQMQAGMEQCSAESMAAIQEVQYEILAAVARVQEYASELYSLVKQCFDNDGKVISGTVCVGKQVFEIRDKVTAAYEIASAAIENAKTRIPEIIEQQQSCADAAKAEPMAELQQILAEVRQCVADNTQ